MDSWQRFIDTVRFKDVDHVPVALLGTPRFFASLAGVKLFECLHDPCKLMEIELQAFRKFPEVTFIPGCWPDYGAGLFSAFGGRISWPEDSMPWVKEYYIRSEEDIKHFKIPDPAKDGFMPWYLETLKLFVKRKKEFSANLHFLHCNGPGELACQLWGMDEFLMRIHLKPQLVKEFLGKLTEAGIIWLEAQREILKDAEGILLTDDIAGLVSPEDYKEFLFPFHRLIREKFREHILVFHCDTKSDHILELLAEVEIDVFNLGPTTDIVDAKKRIGKKVSLMGNIDPVNILQNKDSGVVKKAVEECLKIASPEGRYILSAGGGMNENIPSENIDIMIESVQSIRSL